jgi:hypothetical protein
MFNAKCLLRPLQDQSSSLEVYFRVLQEKLFTCVYMEDVSQLDGQLVIAHHVTARLSLRQHVLTVGSARSNALNGKAIVRAYRLHVLYSA